LPAPAPGPALPPLIVLAGGLGTRLRAAVADRPKVLAPVLGRPFLDHLLRLAAEQGVREAVVGAGHLGEQVEAFVAAGEWGSLRVRCVREEAPLGTAGALRFAAGAAGIAGPFLAMNGDTFLGADLRDLVRWHAERPGAVATMALAQVPATDRYGAVDVDDRGAVRAFREKEPGGGPGWINGGVYLLEPAALAGVEAGRAASLERDVLPALVGRGLYGCPFPGAPFLDIGTPEDYARAAAVLAGARPHPDTPSPAGAPP
jgi:NDP-sugar pyrophosphorylase family protein